jgi:hypothetical protein
MCFVWIWEHTAIISLYSINWLEIMTEMECLLRGTDWIFIYTHDQRNLSRYEFPNLSILAHRPYSTNQSSRHGQRTKETETSLSTDSTKRKQLAHNSHHKVYSYKGTVHC